MRYDDSHHGEHEARPATGLSFGCARTIDEVLAAWHLTYVAGRRRQAIAANRHQLHFPSSAVGPQSVVLIGRIGPVIVSTLTATVENTLGLPADQQFGGELRGLRRPGRVIMELHHFADRRADDERTLDAFMHLMALGWSWGQTHRASDCVIAVDAERAGYFRHAFGFASIRQPGLGAGQATGQVMMCGPMSTNEDDGEKSPAGLRFLRDNLAQPAAFDGRFRFDLGEVRRTALGEYLREKHPVRTAG